MINDESPDSAPLPLNAAVTAALTRLDRLHLADGILQRLTRHVLINRREAMGVDAAAAQMAQALIDQHTAAIREAIGTAGTR